ncbi:exosome complex component (RRP45) [Vairimorpha necatrix]|uniref:Ribosomal RNA-processing protein 42 n=1 Tax=Vairimorpha necatrix TaxID=6039 RepID=A0AAX4JC68_9MICR
MVVKDLLKSYTRLDDRDLLQRRDFKIEKLENFFLITYGDTQIMGMYHLSVGTPYIDKPNEGIVSFNCVAAYKRTDKLNSFLKKIFINQRCIDLEALCIKYATEVKLINIELRILNSDGEVYEPSVLIVNHILNHLKIPVNFLPVCFYFIAIDGVVVRDPTELEENEKDWSYLVVHKSKNEFIYVVKIGKENTLDDIYQVCEITSGSFE